MAIYDMKMEQASQDKLYSFYGMEPLSDQP